MPADPQPIPDTGDLARQPLPRVLLDLWRRGFSGRLRLRHGGTERTVTWLRGAPVGLESSDPDDGLAARLLDDGRITPEQRDAIRKACEKRGIPEAAAVMGLKVLEPKELVLRIREEIVCRLADAFVWPQGSYELDADADTGGRADAFRVDPLQILQTGLAAHWRPDQLLGDLEPCLGRYAVPDEPFDAVVSRLKSSAEGRATIEALDPARTFGEAVCTSLEPERLAVAWILSETGALRFQDAPPAAGDDAAAAGGDAPAEDEDDGDVTQPQLDIQIEVNAAPAEETAAEDEAEGMQLELPSAEAEALRKEILDLHGRLDEVDHYETLGVAADASDAAVKKAYFAAAKRFHPDAVTRLGLSAIHREANEVFARIAQAYQTLSNPQRRQEYDRRDDDGGGRAGPEANRIAQAETLFRKGEVLIKVGNFTGALDFLRPCVELWPEESDYQAALGWALYKAKPSDPERARKHLEKADALRGDQPLVLFRLGMVLRKLGETEAGQKLLDRAKALEKKG